MRLKALLLLCALSGLAHAQFYAPDTQYHDIVQRTFPVEAARVLAWQRHQAGAAPIEAVDFRVETSPARETVWTLTWSSQGKVVREKTVRYPEALLLEGPKFYRDVFTQIVGDDWKIATASPDNAAATFWQGAASAGLSRLEAIRTADQFLAEKKQIERPAEAARLAGILVNAAVPMIGTQTTLDGLLLSRAAAWLCLAETARREPFDAPWAPIEFLAGREKAAAARWTALPMKSPEKQAAPERFWDFLLRRPGVQAMFLFGTRPENKPYAMPVLAYLAHMDSLWAETTVEVGVPIFGEQLLARLYDYLPVFALQGGVDGGHFAGPAPGAFLEAWERALQEFTGDDDGTGGRDLLTKAGAARPEDRDEEDTAAIRRLAPVLNLGVGADGRTPLRPVAHATWRDLLGHGWEAAGAQFGTRHHFLEDDLSDKDSAQRFAAAALSSVHGFEPFFENAGTTPARPLADPGRLEFNALPRVQAALAKRTGPGGEGRPDEYVRRTWLWKTGGAPGLSGALARRGAAQPVREMLVRLAQEGGPLATCELLDPHDKLLAAAVQNAGVIPGLIADIPWAIDPQAQRAWEELGKKGDIFGYAQALEKLTWATGTAIRGSTVFLAYLQTNALASARRFYRQVLPFTTQTVGFSNTTGPMRFALAWWENDEKMMAQALADSETYSYSDLNLRINFALHQGDLVEAEKWIEATRERYGHEEEMDAIKAYLSLVPALKNPQHPDRAKALDGFPKLAYWNWTQWLLARNAKLTKEETLRFLGGDQAIEANHGFIAYLKGDKAAFERIFAKERWSSRRCTGAFLALMRNDLLGIQPPAAEPDLKPADARPLPELIGDALNAATASTVAADLDFSKNQTADEFWAAVERLKEPPRERPDSPEDAMRRGREWLQRQRTAAAAFQKAHPQDARRHDARMLEVGANYQLGRMGDRSIKPPEPAELEAVLAASDASENARGDADFFLIMLETRHVQLSAPHTLPPFHQKLSAYLAKYPSHEHAADVARMQLQLLSIVETPGADTLLKKLTTHPNEQISAPAAALLAQREHITQLKKTPLELKFTAADGQPFDFASLRGKVVLLDFWASWCGPCMADAPKVTATYKKWREKGFEIVGINLDEDKAAMDSATRKMSMTWTQAHDGKGWDGELVKRFGIRSIPATWLFDRQGKLREVGLRGEELESGVVRLLEEK